MMMISNRKLLAHVHRHQVESVPGPVHLMPMTLRVAHCRGREHSTGSVPAGRIKAVWHIKGRSNPVPGLPQLPASKQCKAGQVTGPLGSSIFPFCKWGMMYSPLFAWKVSYRGQSDYCCERVSENFYTDVNRAYYTNDRFSTSNIFH